MKKLFLFFLIIQSFLSFSQDTISTKTEGEDNTFPLMTIDEIPIYPGCEEVEKSERIKCFNGKINRHIVEKFNYPDEAFKKNIQGRVTVIFIINKEGKVEDIRPRGPIGGELLEKEAYRIIRLLPIMKPGIQDGKPVKVRYVIPITFRLN